MGVIKFLTKLKRVYRVMHLFDEDKIANNFRGMFHFFEAKEISASDQPFRFPKGKEISLPDQFMFEGSAFKSSEYLNSAFDIEKIKSNQTALKEFIKACRLHPQTQFPLVLRATPDKKNIYITIRVEEGEKYSVGEVNFSGDLLFSDQELFDVLLRYHQK